MSSTADDLRAAFASASSNPAPAAVDVPPTPTPAPSEPTPAPTPAPAGQGRDEMGRFAASPAAPGAPATPTPTDPPTPTPSGAPEATVAAPGAPGAPAPAADTGPAIFDPAKPPSGWTAEMKGKWDSIPEDIRKEVIRREEASHLGFEKFRKQMEPAQQVYDAVAQHADYFQQIQRDPVDYVGEMIHMERSLATGNPAQKMETLLTIADGYGVALRQILDQAMNGQLDAVIQEGHRHHKTPAQVPLDVQRELYRLRQLEASQHTARFEQELGEMSADKANYPLFDDAREGMAEAIESGRAKDFKEAYEVAVWTNPALRAKAMAVSNGANMVDAVRQRQAVAASAASPTPAPLSAPTQSGQNESTEDDIRRAIAAAASSGRA